MLLIRLVFFGYILSILTTGAQAGPLTSQLAGLGFLIGSWRSGVGQVAETGGTSQGSSVMSAEADGAVLLRRDHVELFDKTGKQTGAFDILMTIYAEDGAIHADYFDADHTIHYKSASIVPGKSVTFVTDAAQGAPAFRLIYTMAGSKMTISFAMAPPGQTIFHPIADGTLLRAN